MIYDGFPYMVMYGCESWTPRKSEQKRMEAFEMWCWRQVLQVKWTDKIPNIAVLAIITFCHN